MILCRAGFDADARATLHGLIANIGNTIADLIVQENVQGGSLADWGACLRVWHPLEGWPEEQRTRKSSEER
jgi:hypothetical protein